MEECFRCGIYGSKIKFYDAIFDKGIVRVCEECALRENIPLVKKPTTFQLKESEKEPVKFKDRVKVFEQRRPPEKSEFLKKRV